MKRKKLVEVFCNGKKNRLSPFIGNGTSGLRMRVNLHFLNENLNFIDYKFNGLRTDEQFKRLLIFQLILLDNAIERANSLPELEPSR